MIGRLRAVLATPPRGYEAWYDRATSWWRSNPNRIRVLSKVCDVLKLMCYVAYPALLVWLWVCGGGLTGDLVASVVIPASGFALCTALRIVFDEPRPYEACRIRQLIAKDTRGKSFPSRHVFSILVIAMSWLHATPAVGLAVLAASFVMAAARVLGGVHYPRDVVAGAVLGAVWGLLLWPLGALLPVSW